MFYMPYHANLLQLFQRRPVQLSVAGEKQFLLDPVTVYDAKTPVTFRVSSGDQFLSPEIFLMVECKVKNGDGSDLTGGEIAVSPNFVHCLWSDVEIMVNGTLISGRNRLYPYRCFFDNIYLTTEMAKQWIDGTGTLRG